jgi:hypothetical protein
MYDSLRESEDDSNFLDALSESPFEDYAEKAPPRRFLGMTAGQRFTISLLLLGMVVVVGLLCLLVFEKVLIF